MLQIISYFFANSKLLCGINWWKDDKNDIKISAIHANYFMPLRWSLNTPKLNRISVPDGAEGDDWVVSCSVTVEGFSFGLQQSQHSSDEDDDSQYFFLWA